MKPQRFGGVIDAAPKWTRVESLAHPEQTGSPQCSLIGVQLPLLLSKHFHTLRTASSQCTHYIQKAHCKNRPLEKKL